MLREAEPLPRRARADSCVGVSSSPKAVRPATVKAANPLAELAMPEAMGKLFWLTTRAR